MAPDDGLVVRADPTKEFFVYMLTRDILLFDAIGDLVDNSIDGARRLRADGPYDGLTIRLDVTGQRFRIVDNCGGIPLHVAQNYAFRFGRDPAMKRDAKVSVTHFPLGQFGVGMKRALFKMGARFQVESGTLESTFSIVVDVDNWIMSPDWNLRFSSVAWAARREDETYTRVEVDRLHENVAREFANDSFQNRLRRHIAQSHQHRLDRGLAISVNGIPCDFESAALLNSEELSPAYLERKFERESGAPMTIRIYAGVGQSSPDNAGWYIYCNGRLVVAHDQSLLTGWGDELAKYHNQYARFRGYVFFDSDDASFLPWRTTKTSIDEDSAEYKAIRDEMVILMRQVFRFLNKLKDEKDRLKDEVEEGSVASRTPLEDLVINATPVPLSSLTPTSTFSFTERVSGGQPKRHRYTSIQYKRRVEEVEKAKMALGVGSNALVGERTFQYFYDAECDQ